MPSAIKVHAKKYMDKWDLELSITKINIWKICQQSYTTKLYDTFETGDHIYIKSPEINWKKFILD